MRCECLICRCWTATFWEVFWDAVEDEWRRLVRIARSQPGPHTAIWVIQHETRPS
jgi:hypothetical protein